MTNKKQSNNMHATNAGRALARREALLKDRLGEQVCSLNDPFCQRANGARWSTVGSTPTVTYQYRGIYTITPAATSAGWIGLVFCPSNAKNFFYADDMNGGGVNMSVPANLTNSDSALNAFMDACDEVRVVSAGLKWWDVSPKTGAGGIVVAKEYSSVDDVLGTTVALGSLVEAPLSDSFDRRTPQGGCWIQRPTDFNAYEFTAPTTNVDTNNARSCLVLSASSDISVPSISVEFVINYEGVPAAASALLRLGKTQRDSPMQQLATKISDGLWSSISTIRKGATASISNYMKQYAKRVASGFLGPAAGVAGLLTDAYDVD